MLNGISDIQWLFKDSKLMIGNVLPLKYSLVKFSRKKLKQCELKTLSEFVMYSQMSRLIKRLNEYECRSSFSPEFRTFTGKKYICKYILKGN